MDEYDRGRVWRLYGWFTALMACGSCVGAVAWGARMTDLVLSYESLAINSRYDEYTLQMALVYRWRSAFLVTYAI